MEAGQGMEHDAPRYHPAVAGVLRFFEFDHLPPGIIRDTAQEFHGFAHLVADTFINHSDPELTYGLRDLLRAKDCAVRCAVLVEKASRGMKTSDTIPNPSEFLPGTALEGVGYIDDQTPLIPSAADRWVTPWEKP